MARYKFYIVLYCIASVKQKEDRSEDRSLWDATYERSRIRWQSAAADELGTTVKVWSKPAEHRTT